MKVGRSEFPTPTASLPKAASTKSAALSAQVAAVQLPTEAFTPSTEESKESVLGKVGKFAKRVGGSIAPFVLAGAGIAAGLAVAIGTGGVAIAAGAAALGVLGAGAGVAATLLKDVQNPGYKGGLKEVLIGGAVGAGLGVVAGVVGGPIAGAAVGLLSGGSGLAYGLALRSASRDEG